MAPVEKKEPGQWWSDDGDGVTERQHAIEMLLCGAQVSSNIIWIWGRHHGGEAAENEIGKGIEKARCQVERKAVRGGLSLPSTIKKISTYGRVHKICPDYCTYIRYTRRKPVPRGQRNSPLGFSQRW